MMEALYQRQRPHLRHLSPAYGRSSRVTWPARFRDTDYPDLLAACGQGDGRDRIGDDRRSRRNRPSRCAAKYLLGEKWR
jgi:hypothetical protein